MQDHKNTKPTIEALICDESFVNYCLDKSHPDYERWSNWLAENPAAQESVDEAMIMVQLLRERPSDQEVALARERLLETLGINNTTATVKPIGTSKRYRWLAIAGVFIAIAMAFLYSNKNNLTKTNTLAQQEIITQEVPAGQAMHLRLSDGTAVDLTAGSSFSYPAQFNDSLRIVDLAGDARFAVSHNADKPFLIRAGDLQVRVLGTVFNVQAFQTDQDIRVALFEGSVQVEKEGRQLKVLPGQVFVYNKLEDTFTITAFDKQEEEERLQGLLVFNKASYQEVATRLAHRYKVTFTPDESVDIAFSGKIADKSIASVLEKLSQTTAYQFSLKSDSIIVKHK